MLAGGRRFDGAEEPDQWFVDMSAVWWMLDRIEAGDGTASELRDALVRTTQVELFWDQLVLSCAVGLFGCVVQVSRPTSRAVSAAVVGIKHLGQPG